MPIHIKEVKTPQTKRYHPMKAGEFAGRSLKTIIFYITAIQGMRDRGYQKPLFFKYSQGREKDEGRGANPDCLAGGVGRADFFLKLSIPLFQKKVYITT